MDIKRVIGRLVIVASKGGAPSHPDWYYNLVANPIVGVEDGRLAVERDDGVDLIVLERRVEGGGEVGAVVAGELAAQVAAAVCAEVGDGPLEAPRQALQIVEGEIP